MKRLLSASSDNIIPDNLSVETGLVVDSTGGVSKQIDIIIFDKAKTPVLFFAGGVRVIPVECVYVIIEVKTSLDGAALEQCLPNMESVKSLQRIAYYEPGVIAYYKRMYGIEFSDWQTIYFVFAYESMPANSIIEQLEEYSKTVPVNLRIDSVYSLQHGLITFEVFDQLGRVALQGDFILSSQIDISDRLSGLHFVRVMDATGRLVGLEKLMIVD